MTWINALVHRIAALLTFCNGRYDTLIHPLGRRRLADYGEAAA